MATLQSLLHGCEKALLAHPFTCWKSGQWGCIVFENIQRKLTRRVFMGLEQQKGKCQVQTSLHCQKVEGSGKNEVNLSWNEGCYKIVEMFKSM